MAEQKRKVKFLNAFMSVWTIHKSGEPSELLIDTYWKVLKKYSDEEIEQAFGYSIESLQWFPKPVELIQFIESGPGNIEDIALVEADKVLKAIREVGHSQSVTFDDPVTMAVVSQGWHGWMEICEMKVDEEKWFRKDFVKIYKAYSAQGIKKYGKLIGFHENHNAIRWPEHVPGTVLIGDERKAVKVLEYNKKKEIENKG